MSNRSIELEATLRLALEALEDIRDDCAGCDFEWNNDYPLQAKAHAAIKETLAQEKSLQALHDENERLGLYKEAYAQPAVSETHKQEPVEWGVDWGKDGNSVSIIKRLSDGNIEVLAWEYAPHPPQRTWVGLSDGDFAEACQMAERGNYLVAFQRIQAKLKEKNFS